MGQKVMIGIVVSMLCCNAIAKPKPVAHYDAALTTTTASGKQDNHATQHHCTTCNDSSNDKDVAQKAISTLASMAMSILNIGTDSHNPQVVGANVINILSSFVNFVTFAMKNPEVAELLNDEDFQEALRNYIVRSLVEKQPDMLDEIV